MFEIETTEDRRIVLTIETERMSALHYLSEDEAMELYAKLGELLEPDSDEDGDLPG